MSRASRALCVAGVSGIAMLSVPAPRAVSSARGSTAAVNAGIAPDSISGVNGQRATVALQMDLGATGKLLASYAVGVTWDSTIVRLDSVSSGTFSLPLVNYVNGGEVRLTSVVTQGLGGAFTLGRLHFHFVSNVIGLRTVLQPAFTELTATDFTDLRADFATLAGVARVLPPTVRVLFSPDSVRERVGFRPEIALAADLSAGAGVLLGSYAATVTWDPAIMVLDSVGTGDYAAPQTNQVTAGELRLTAANAQGTGGTTPSLARLFFRYVTATFPTQTTLAVSVGEMHAAVTFADLLPGVVAGGGKALIGGVFRGDIDIDGSLAALDAQLILQGVVGLSLPPGAAALPNGDADCNGALQAKDAQIVLNQVVDNDVSQFCVASIR